MMKEDSKTVTYSVQNLKETIASIIPVSLQDQILLLVGKKLDDRRNLEYYGLPSKEKEVFLFNRRAIADPNYPLEDSAPPLIEIKVPPIPPLSKEFESRPLIHALKTYEHQFQTHFLIAKAILEAYDKRLYSCKLCYSEIHVQVRGIECAIINLNDHMGQLSKSHEDFTAHAKLQIMESDELLDNFDHDLATLREVHIHSSLAPPGATLLDRVPEAKLRVWAKDGRADNDHIKMRIPDMENYLRQLQLEVDAEIKRPYDVDLRELSERIFHSEEVLKDMHTKVQMFEKDFINVRGRVEVALRNTQGQNLGNFCDGFDEIAKVHEAHLSYLRAQGEASKENFLVFARCKGKLSRGVYNRIRSVSAYQTRIRESHNTMQVMGEALSRLKAAFGQLTVVKNMPPAYRAAVQEVARRRGFGKKIRREVARMNEVMAKIRDEEIPKRDSFFNKYYHLVPKDLMPGLQDSLPVLDVMVPPFDANLPQIDSDSASGEEDDFTIVPFGDEPMPRLQSFDRDNAFSQSGSNNYNYNPNNPNPSPAPPPSPSPYHTFTSPIPSSNPIPISSTKGFATPVHTSGGPLSASPGSDVVKLQRDLAAAREVATNYADRIKHLEGELNKLYKEKVELTQQKLDGANIGGSRLEAEMRNLLSSREETIRSLQAELDSVKEREERERGADAEKEALSARVFEQERQIEHLMTALHTPPEPLLVSARTQGDAQAQEMEDKLKRLVTEVEEWKRRDKDWEEERREAAAKYEGMMRQLHGELDHLREEKLHTSRSWTNEKLELEKAQKVMDKMKEDSEAEQKKLEDAIKDLQRTVKQQEEVWSTEKQDLDQQMAEIRAASDVNSQQWAKEKEAMTESFNKEKQALVEVREKEAELQKDLDATQNTLGQLRKELDTLQMEEKKLREDLATTSDSLRDKEQQIKQLEKEKDDLRDQVANLEGVMTQKDKTSLEVAQDLAELRKANGEAEVRATAFQNQLDELQKRKQDLDRSVESLKGERQALSEKIAHTHKTHVQELESLNLALRAKDAALNDAAANLKAAKERLKDKEEETNDKEVTTRTISKELGEAQAALQAKEQELQHAGKLAHEQEERIASAENDLREKDAALRAQEDALREKLRAHEDTVREKDAALRATEEALREKETALLAKDAALSESEAALRVSEAALSKSEDTLREKDAALAHGEEMSRSVADLSELIQAKEKGFSEGVLDYERKLMEMEERQKQEETNQFRVFQIEREEMINAHNTKTGQLQLQVTEYPRCFHNIICELKNESVELKTVLSGLQSQLKDQGIAHAQEIEGQVQRFAKKEAEISEISVQIQKKNSVLEKKLQDVEDEKRKIQQQLEQHVAAGSKDDQMKRVITDLSENLKNHPACQNLQDKDADVVTQFQTRVSAVIAFVHNLEEERDHAAIQHVTEASQLRTLLQTKEDRVADLERNLQDTQGQLAAWQMSQNESVPSKISFSKFKDGDLVLFLPKNKYHEAFNIACPNYYLSEDCAGFFENQTYICGQVVEINSRKASARDNPFKLPEGTEFHEVTITSI